MVPGNFLGPKPCHLGAGTSHLAAVGAAMSGGRRAAPAPTAPQPTFPPFVFQGLKFIPRNGRLPGVGASNRPRRSLCGGSYTQKPAGVHADAGLLLPFKGARRSSQWGAKGSVPCGFHRSAAPPPGAGFLPLQSSARTVRPWEAVREARAHGDRGRPSRGKQPTERRRGGAWHPRNRADLGARPRALPGSLLTRQWRDQQTHGCC